MLSTIIRNILSNLILHHFENATNIVANNIKHDYNGGYKESAIFAQL